VANLSDCHLAHRNFADLSETRAKFRLGLFLQFSYSVLTTCREICEDAGSCTKFNKQLEDDCRIAKEYRQALALMTSATGRRRRVALMARDCAQDAEELVSLLETVRGAGGHVRARNLGKARALFRAMKEKGTIEKLQNRLKDRERRLNEVLVQETHTSVEAMHEEIGRMKISLPSVVDKAMSSAQAQTQARLSKAQAAIQSDIHLHGQQARSRHAELQQGITHWQFLDSLSFPDMDQRRNGIKDPYPGTFEWIFNPPSDEHRPRANFWTWLCKDSSVYWISGKAASGKSTLMANIVDHERTEEGLRRVLSDYCEAFFTRFVLNFPTPLLPYCAPHQSSRGLRSH
jgi:hypothetical protein